MRERIRHDDAPRLALQTVIADRAGGIQPLLDIVPFQNLAHAIGAIGPHAREAVRLQFEPDRYRVRAPPVAARALGVSGLQDAELVLYSGAVESACGMASSASGPFYCPRDRKVYLDLSFFEDMRRKLNAPGDFAQAYVIAHEIGHHVQNALGILEAGNAERARSDKRRANAISVRLELQADCFAGVWANRANRMRQILEQGDVEEGLNAASAVGDDRLQRQARGVVVPDAFTHGSSAQRAHWFKTGLQSGKLKACDTFAAADLGTE